MFTAVAVVLAALAVGSMAVAGIIAISAPTNSDFIIYAILYGGSACWILAALVFLLDVAFHR